jgi:hypothetical protein
VECTMANKAQPLVVLSVGQLPKPVILLCHWSAGVGSRPHILHSLLLWLCLSRLAEMESQNCSFFNDSLSPDDSM